jgi:hypothetical protein
MSWLEFDELQVAQSGVIYHSDRVPGRLFKLQLTTPRPGNRPAKLFVRRWLFDETGDRAYFGQTRSIWVPPNRHIIDLGVNDPDIQENAGVALSCAERYDPFGTYVLSVWESPNDMTKEFPFDQSNLEPDGSIVCEHNLDTVLLTYALLDNTGEYTNPRRVVSNGVNSVRLYVDGYTPITGIWRFIIERRGS